MPLSTQSTPAAGGVAGARRRNPRGQGGRLAEDILDTARQIIEETGDEGQVTLRGIARRLGVSAQSLYSHFSGVQAICREVVIRSYDRFAEATVEALPPDADAAERIRAMAALYIRFARDHPQLYRLLFNREHPSEVRETGDRGRALFAQLTATLSEALAGRSLPANQVNGRALGLWLELHGIATLPVTNPRLPWPDDDTLVNGALERAGLPAAPPPTTDPS